VECELLDYKETVADDRYAKAKTALQVISLFNTYGGYLVYGVREDSPDTEYRVVGIEKNILDLESIKALVKDLTGERIPISLQYFALSAGVVPGSSNAYLGVIFVPKRTAKDPLAFGKNGPHGKDGRPLFEADDVYYRRGDECVPAKGKAVLHLSGPRPCPYERARSSIDVLVVPQIRLQHNLPDRNLICPRFIGRGEEIDELWAWMGDELSHIRVLAGEGGLGKTSIAYQFAEEVCVSPESEVERIVWLTAKKSQFSGMLNVSVEIPETHFESYPELLSVLAAEFGYLNSELDGLSEKKIKKLLQDGAQLIPTLLIIDDVDSLEPEEQRKTLEIGFILGGTKSRLLMTTRINQSYSTDIAIQVKGFPIDDYSEYVKSLHDRYPYVKLDRQQVESMHEVTSGNPLFTESLYRLMRGMAPGEAIKQWRGRLGEDARAAALSREVDQLSAEAKRVLLAAALLNESSFAELAEVTGYTDAVIHDRVGELQSIYLVSAPMFTSERRVKIAANTRNYSLSIASRLVADHTRLEKRVTELRSQVKLTRLKRDNPMVGAAISQAMAQIAQGNARAALDTVIAARKQLKDHPDLLVMQARCLLKAEPSDADEARRLARQAYEAGVRKDILFDVWYQAESLAGHHSGAAEAAASALDNGAEPRWQWLVQRAAASWHVAQDQEKAGHFDRAISDYWLSAEDLKQAQALVRGGMQSEILQQRFAAHDSVWEVLRRSDRYTIDVPARAVSEVIRMIRTGDVRMPTFLRLCDALKWICQVLARGRGALSEGLHNLVDQRFRESREVVRAQASHRSNDARFAFVEQKLREVEDELAGIVRRRSLGLG
jgi:hypothetical protein